MINMIQADFYRVLHSKTVKMLLAITTVFSVILMGCAYLMAQGALGSSFFGLIFVTSDMNMTSLAGTILAVHLIGSEFESRNMQHLVTSGMSRTTIVVSKMITYCTVYFVIISPYFIASIITLTMDASFNSGSELAGIMMFVQHKELLPLSTGVLFLVVIAFVYVAQLSTAVLLSFIFKKASFVIPIFYFISVTCGQIALYQEQIGDAAKLLNVTPFASKFITMTAVTPTSTLVSATITSALYIVAMTALACVYFRKREIK